MNGQVDDNVVHENCQTPQNRGGQIVVDTIDVSRMAVGNVPGNLSPLTNTTNLGDGPENSATESPPVPPTQQEPTTADDAPQAGVTTQPKRNRQKFSKELVLMSKSFYMKDPQHSTYNVDLVGRIDKCPKKPDYRYSITWLQTIAKDAIPAAVVNNLNTQFGTSSQVKEDLLKGMDRCKKYARRLPHQRSRQRAAAATTANNNASTTATGQLHEDDRAARLRQAVMFRTSASATASTASNTAFQEVVQTSLPGSIGYHVTERLHCVEHGGGGAIETGAKVKATSVL